MLAAFDVAGADVLCARGRGEGYRVVPAPARAAGVGRRHRGPLHPLLEHAHFAAPAVRRHRYTKYKIKLPFKY